MENSFVESREESPREIERGDPVSYLNLIPLLIIGGGVIFLTITLFGGMSPDTFSPIVAFIALFAFIFAIIDTRIGLLMLIFSIGLSPEFTISGIPNIRLEDFLIPVLLVAWIIRSIGGREEFSPTPLKLPILLYLATMVFSGLFGVMNGNIETTKCFLYLGKITEYFLIFLIIINTLKTYRDVKAFIILSIVICVIGSFRSLLTYEEYRTARLAGPMGETATILGGYLIMHMGIVVGLFLFLDKMVLRVILAMVFFLLTYILMLTFSRTSYVAFAAGFLFLGLLRKRQLIAIAVIALVLLPFVQPEAVTEVRLPS